MAQHQVAHPVVIDCTQLSKELSSSNVSDRVNGILTVIGNLGSANARTDLQLGQLSSNVGELSSNIKRFCGHVQKEVKDIKDNLLTQNLRLQRLEEEQHSQLSNEIKSWPPLKQLCAFIVKYKPLHPNNALVAENVKIGHEDGVVIPLVLWVEIFKQEYPNTVKVIWGQYPCNRDAVQTHFHNIGARPYHPWNKRDAAHPFAIKRAPDSQKTFVNPLCFFFPLALWHEIRDREYDNVLTEEPDPELTVSLPFSCRAFEGDNMWIFPLGVIPPNLSLFKKRSRAGLKIAAQYPYEWSRVTGEELPEDTVLPEPLVTVIQRRSKRHRQRP